MIKIEVSGNTNTDVINNLKELLEAFAAIGSEEPKKEEKVKEEVSPKKEEPKKEIEEPKKEAAPTAEDMKALMKQIIGMPGEARDKAKAVLGEYGAKRLTELPEEHYTAAYTKLQEIANG